MLRKIFTSFLAIAFLSAFLPSRSFAQEEVYYYCDVPNSHIVGDQCHCDEGYISYGGKCRTPEALCRSFNATYSPAIGDCKCADGYVEKNNYCVKEETKAAESDIVEKENISTEATKEIEKLPVKKVDEKTTNDSNETDELYVSNSKSAVEEKLEAIMEKYYAKYDPETQAVIKESAAKIEEIKDESLKPQDDIYGEIESDSDDFVTIAPFKVPIEESFEFINKEEKEEAEDQMSVLADFSDSGDEQEVSLDGDKDIIGEFKEELIDYSYQDKVKEWQEERKNVEKKYKLKKGVTVTEEEIKTEEEMESRLKWQIATISKAIGYEHLRIIETTGIVKKDKMPQPVSFDRMSSDYKEHFNNQSATDDNEWSSQGVAFNKSYLNIVGMSKQLKDLKKELKKKYPDGWKEKYFDYPEKPTREKVAKESGSVFDTLQNIKEKSKKKK